VIFSFRPWDKAEKSIYLFADGMEIAFDSDLRFCLEENIEKQYST